MKEKRESRECGSRKRERQREGGKSDDREKERTRGGSKRKRGVKSKKEVVGEWKDFRGMRFQSAGERKEEIDIDKESIRTLRGHLLYIEKRRNM